MNMPAQALIPLLEDAVLSRGAHARLTVSGSSMQPFLRSGDVVELIPPRATVEPGDVVLVRRDDDTYVLHRVVRVRDARFWLLGDAQHLHEGPFARVHLVAHVAAAWRENRELRVRPAAWRLWYWLAPCRHGLLLWAARLRRVRAWMTGLPRRPASPSLL